MTERRTFLKQIELAREFSKYNEPDRMNLIDKVYSKAGNKVEYYKKV